MRFISTAAAKNLTDKLRQAGIANEQVLNVIANTPRELFIDDALAHKAYENTALPIGLGQTISQPYIVARMTEILLQKPAHNVLEIGTGSGYQAAILAPLVEQLFTVERIKALQIKARMRLKRLDLHNIAYKYADGWQGWANRGPFDAIIVTAAAKEIPQALLLQLEDGGRLIIPVGELQQQLLCVERNQDQFFSTVIEAVKFVPLVNGGLA